MVDLIIACIENPKASNQTFLVSDDATIYTSQLLSAINKGFNKPSRLLPCRIKTLKIGVDLLVKKHTIQQLLDDLELDITKTMLNWTPTKSVERGLKDTTNWYRNQ